VSISIFLFGFIFILGFKLILGDKLLYVNSTEEAFSSEGPIIKYSGYEEDENTYKIKVNIKNNSKYYASLNNIDLLFSHNTKDKSGHSSNAATPVFKGYDNTERKYLLNFKPGVEENTFSPYLAPNEEREYVFEISKGLKFDKEVFDTNRMAISYG
ncbi:hypothetical protein, partial [Clostridium perfringens]|uniref:hypothetical protein n=1 Tax=Clostridium perfringens TaxID=1502 RepID=UPI002ACC3544